MKLSNVIRKESNWAQHCDAVDKSGNLVYLNEFPLNEQPKPKNFKAYSLYGALVMFEPYERGESVNPMRSKQLSKLKKAIRLYTGKDMGLAEFNNHVNTNFEDIQEVIRISEAL